jgi:hypothetical protein
MTKPYKLRAEIKQFIIERKGINPRISCRGLVALIKEYYDINMSKSLVNSVLKEQALSSPVGRRKKKEATVVQQSIAMPEEKKVKREMIENGGFFFLLAADNNLSLAAQLAQNLAGLFKDFSKEDLQNLLLTLVFSPFFKDKDCLWEIIRSQPSPKLLEKLSNQLAASQFSQLKEAIMNSGIKSNPLDCKELYHKFIFRLNAHVQSNFFPSIYQSLDFSDMQERFYSLLAKTQEGTGILKVSLFYPQEFPWRDDLVWQEDFAFAAHKLNEFRVTTQRKEVLWINPRLEVLPTNFI